MPDQPAPPGFEEIQRAELSRVFGKVVGARLLIAPLVALAAAALALWDPGGWRRAVLFTAAFAMVTVSIVEVVRYRRRGLAPGAIAFNIGLGVYGQLAISGATGALESPMLPTVLLLAFVSGVFIENVAARAVLLGSQVAAVLGFAVIEVWSLVPEQNLRLFGGGARAGHTDVHLWTAAAVYVLAIVGVGSFGRALQSVFESMLRRALEAREESLRAYAERARELTALSGEIAHELKNPMASVKGLAALLAKTQPEGKDAERLGVLRREVDRMQGILDEFLNFSRPLVPLALEQVEVLGLCREVGALHEGLGRERGVGIAVSGRQAVARCDPRKVKQVLVNLLQNALDVAPPGSQVAIEVGGEGERVAVRILDAGPGLDPAVAGRLFEPGVTTKTRGSGLGLTIARALARQHGGELTLSAREGGGCRAELWLPTTPVAPAEPEGVSA